MDAIINSFRGKYFFLSNFYPIPNGMQWDGHLCSTSEHAYQLEKSYNEDERELICLAATPQQAKKLGRNALYKRANFHRLRLQIMEDILRVKFKKDLLQQLINTYPAVLIEGNNWHDIFFGVCYCTKCDGQGENHLGKLLMKIRDEVIAEMRQYILERT